MTQTAEFAAWIGIDWGHEKHAFHMLSEKGTASSGELIHSPEAIAQWVAQLQQRFPGRRVAVCLEQTRGALTYALMQHEFLVLHPLNPRQLADYRDAVYPSGAKTDPADAELLARFLRDHPDKVRAWSPDDATTRGLRLMTEQRRKWVEERVGLTNELQQRLKESFPLALELAGNTLYSESFLTLLEKFPSQRELQRASPKQLEKYLPRRRRAADDPPAEELLRERIKALRIAPALTADGPVLDHARLAVSHLVTLIQAHNRAIAECDRKIAALFAEHPDAELFTSFPGAGPALAPRLAAAYGTNRDKFQDAQEMQQFSGIAPVVKTSGKTRIVQMRWACPKFLRQTFHEFARCSIANSAWARAYVNMRTKQGDGYQEILRGLAFKWQRILYRCWKNNEAYDEDRYLQRLRSTGSNLIAFLSPEPITST